MDNSYLARVIVLLLKVFVEIVPVYSPTTTSSSLANSLSRDTPPSQHMISEQIEFDNLNDQLAAHRVKTKCCNTDLRYLLKNVRCIGY